MKKKTNKKNVTLFKALFGNQIQKYFRLFALIKKNSLF